MTDEERKRLRREASARYRAKHPDKAAEYSQRYRESNPGRSAENSRRYRERNPGRQSENSKRYRESHLEQELSRKREYMRKRHATIESFYYYLRYYYGAGADLHYAEQFKKQEGLCATCGSAPKPKQRLHLDHNHGTRQLRGLLCGDCNRALGLCKENVERILKLARYIEEWGIAKAA